MCSHVAGPAAKLTHEQWQDAMARTNKRGHHGEYQASMTCSTRAPKHWVGYIRGLDDVHEGIWISGRNMQWFFAIHSVYLFYFVFTCTEFCIFPNPYIHRHI